MKADCDKLKIYTTKLKEPLKYMTELDSINIIKERRKDNSK